MAGANAVWFLLGVVVVAAICRWGCHRLGLKWLDGVLNVVQLGCFAQMISLAVFDFDLIGCVRGVVARF